MKLALVTPRARRDCVGRTIIRLFATMGFVRRSAFGVYLPDDLPGVFRDTNVL